MFSLKRKFKQRKNELPSQREILRDLRNSKRFYGVQIGQCGCKASSRYAGKFFSFKKVPSLPVKGCDAQECHCVYVGVTNRRSDMDRRFSGGLEINEKRRKVFDRRKGEDIWKGVDN